MSFEKLRQFKNEELKAENKRLRDVVATLQRAGIIGVDAERLLEAEIKILREALEEIAEVSEVSEGVEFYVMLARKALKEMDDG